MFDLGCRGVQVFDGSSSCKSITSVLKRLILTSTEVNEIQDEEGGKSVAPSPLQPRPFVHYCHMGSIAHDDTNVATKAIFEFCSLPREMGLKLTKNE